MIEVKYLILTRRGEVLVNKMKKMKCLNQLVFFFIIELLIAPATPPAIPPPMAIPLSYPSRFRITITKTTLIVVIRTIVKIGFFFMLKFLIVPLKRLFAFLLHF